jgi:glutathione S-transferase
MGVNLKMQATLIHKGQTRTPEFLKLNPAAQVPVLVDELPGRKPFVLASRCVYAAV